MKSTIKSTVVLFGTLLAIGAGLAFTPRTAMAAHSGTPYANIDQSNDRGNNTDDSQIEGLNERQLDQNYQRNAHRPGRCAPSAVLCTPSLAALRQSAPND